MRDAECVRFLRWALPRLGFRWRGFRRVRRQVCRRVEARRLALGLPDLEAYRAHLLAEPGEWERLAALCRVTISRFFRDREVFRVLGEDILPRVAALSRDGGLRLWSAGCGAGEEPYSLALLAWRTPALAGVEALILGTDVDPVQLARARRAVYPESSLRDLPRDLREAAFTSTPEGEWRLRPQRRRGVGLALQDLRRAAPAGPFAAILCRNLAYTYFGEPLQRQVAARLRGCLLDGGALVVGAHERLPDDCVGYEPWPGRSGIWRAVSERREPSDA